MPTLDEVREAFQNSGEGLDFKRVHAAQGLAFDEWLAGREAAAVRAAAARVSQVMNDPDRVRPQVGEFASEKANDIAWALLILGQCADDLEARA